MATPEEILRFQEKIAQSQAAAFGESVDKLGRNFDQINNQLNGLATAVYTQSVTQIVPMFEGDPKKYKEWLKAVEKYAKLTNISNNDVPKIAYQTCSGPVGDFIRRYLQEKEEQGRNADWDNLKKHLSSRFADITDAHQAFAVLRKTKQKPNESVQLYAERLLNIAEDAYPVAGDRPVVEQQLINIFLDGLYFDYLKMKILREDPKTFDEAIQVALREQNIRKRFSLRNEDNPKTTQKQSHSTQDYGLEPMEVDHFRPRRCFKCKRVGHWAKDCKVKTINEVQNPVRSGGFGRPRSQNVTNYKQQSECWYCKKLGHWRNECPERLSNSAYNQGN